MQRFCASEIRRSCASAIQRFCNQAPRRFFASATLLHRNFAILRVVYTPLRFVASNSQHSKAAAMRFCDAAQLQQMQHVNISATLQLRQLCASADLHFCNSLVLQSCNFATQRCYKTAPLLLRASTILRFRHFSTVAIPRFCSSTIASTAIELSP